MKKQCNNSFFPKSVIALSTLSLIFTNGVFAQEQDSNVPTQMTLLMSDTEALTNPIEMSADQAIDITKESSPTLTILVDEETKTPASSLEGTCEETPVTALEETCHDEQIDALESTCVETPVTVLEDTCEENLVVSLPHPEGEDTPAELVQPETPLTCQSDVSPQDELNLEKTSLSINEETLAVYAEQMIRNIGEKLECKDFPHLIQMSAKMLECHSDLNLQEKKEASFKLLNYVLDHAETPWLVDNESASSIKDMLPSFIDLFMTENALTQTPFSVPQNVVDNKDSVGVVEILKEKFSEGFQWNDLTYSIEVAFSFGSKFDDLTWDERRFLMVELIDYLIDNTDRPCLPEAFSADFFKACAHETIQILVSSEQNSASCETHLG